MSGFRTILEKDVSAEIVEKKSKFIANLFFVDSSEEAEQLIKSVKKKYFDAKHNCFAYLVYENNVPVKKFSDDGEPSGTAGAPMLEILEKQNLGNVLVVVTRYFGGILLGTGGLVRAYSDSLKKALDIATFVMLEHGFELDVELAYSDLDKFKYYCNKNNINIVNCSYLDTIVCRIELNDLEKEKIEKNMKEQNDLNIKKIDIVRQKNVSILSNNVD